MTQTQTRELYETYGFVIYGRCLRILGSPQDAQDAVQIVFMKLIQNYDSIRNKQRIVPWIYTAAKHHCFNLLRKRRKFIDNDQYVELPSPERFEQEVDNRMLIDIIMRHHSPKVQEAVYYTYVERLNQNEIQRVCGQSPATVRRNLKTFKESLPHIRKRLGIA
ncbi:MAG: sigma-70 family RNA polymerase sigma factor [Chitinivibrionales bacterium]|nr:sigma-70 family RNA polymerase sigma factor [Chitinivibrionales bacterium]